MQQTIKRHSTKIRFGMIGALNTLIDFGILFFLVNFTGINKLLANIFSTFTAFVFSFFANKKYTFKSNSKNVLREMFLFTIVTLFGLWIIQGFLLHILTPPLKNLGINENLALLIAKLIASVASLVWNYLFYSKLVFKTRSEK